MAMTEHAYVMEEAASFETRQMRVLDGGAARERANARRADVVKLGLAVVAVLVYMLSLTFVSARITAAGAEINSINEAIADLENDAALADMAIGEKSSLERVEAYAIGELGMVYPDPGATYFLSEQSSQAIATGRMALAAAAVAEEPAVEAEAEASGGLLSSFKGLFDRTAQAAEVGTD